MSQDPWIWTSDYVIPSRTGAGRRIIDDLLEQLRRHQWEARDIFCVQLAAEEALVNAIKHGNRLDAGKQVCISCRMAPDLLRIEIADQGKGFDPASVPNPTDPAMVDSPRGRGIMLMRSFMSRVEYNEAGNRVVLEKTREGRN